MVAPVLVSERLRYEPLSTAHLSQSYVDWLTDPEVNKYISSAIDTTLESLNEFLIQTEARQILFWAILLKDSGRHIGNIKIDPVSEKHGHCEYGILLGDKSEWGRGYAKEASKRIIDYCFDELNLRKMTLGVMEKNYAAVGLYKSLGFEIEGVYKAHEFYDGEYCDAFRMALFNPNYRATI